MSRIYISGTEARIIRRMARRGMGIALERTESCKIEPFGRRWTPTDSLELHRLKTQLGIADRILTVRVPSHATRVRAKGLRSSVCSVALPQGSFDRLRMGDEGVLGLLPSELDVLVDSPALSFVVAANQLDRLVGSGKIGALEADLRLLKLGFEDCSTYALNPWAPTTCSDETQLLRVMAAEELRSYLGDLHGMDGMGRARSVAELILDNAASQMEAFLAAALCLPPAYGGLGFPKPELNKEKPLSDLQKLKLTHATRITPDLLWEIFLVIIEYLGKEPHESGSAQDEDAGRVQDYQVLGYSVFPVRYRHVCTPAAFNELAVRVAQAMELRGASGLVAWVNELIADEDFLQRQRVLFMVMLPPVHAR